MAAALPKTQFEVAGYELGDPIGSGGMATVYKATQVSLQREVAIKILEHSLLDQPEIRDRFLRESLIIAKLNHPNIIPVIDQGVTPEGIPYFAMVYVKSVSLTDAMETNRISEHRALDIFAQIAKGLSYAHKNGVVHCDIKPDNIIIDFEGVVRILDFGIAKIFEDAHLAHDMDNSEHYILGTENYMAPEQHHCVAKATVKSDLYALGVLMYQFFTQQLPGETPNPANVYNPKVSMGLNELIMQCLQVEPEQRPASADEVQTKLLNLLKGRHIKEAQRQRAKSDVADSFVLLDVVKEDEHASVYLFQRQEDPSSLFVIKKKPAGSNGLVQAKKISALNHPNVARILGTSNNERVFIVVTEYCNGGSLADRMVRRYPLPAFFPIAINIAQGLAQVHRCGVVHGNLRPTNILFDERNIAKLCDFGLDEHYSDNQDNWYAPQNEKTSKSGDVFSAGVVYYQMLFGELPKWKKGELIKNKHFKKLPLPMQGLLNKMLAQDQSKRLASMTIAANVLQNCRKELDETVVRQLHPEECDALTGVCELPPKPKKPLWRRPLILTMAFGVILVAAQIYYFFGDKLLSL